MFELESFHFGLAGIGAGIIGAFWLPRWVSGREPAAAPLLLIAGLVVGLLVPDFARAVDPLREPKSWELASELAIVVALFGTGLRIDRLVPYKRWLPTIRLLLVAMPLCIVIVALLGWLVGGLSFASALLLGAVLAPTDPVLAGDVQVGPPHEGGEHPVRFALTAEAGLNDGLSFPFVLLAMIIAGAGWAPGEWGLEWLARDVVWRIAVGIGGGIGVGWLLGKLLFVWPRTNPLAQTDAGVVALAGVMLAFGLTELAEGYGFIAAFVAGLTLRQSEARHAFHTKLHDFTGAIEHALLALLLVALGTALPSLWESLEWQLALVALALIFLIRPLIAWHSLRGTNLRGRARAVVAFYGVRGLGTIYYLAYALGKLPLANREELWAVAAFTIVVSTIVHGLTAGAAVERATGESQSPAAQEAANAPTPAVATGQAAASPQAP